MKKNKYGPIKCYEVYFLQSGIATVGVRHKNYENNSEELLRSLHCYPTRSEAMEIANSINCAVDQILEKRFNGVS